MLRRPAELARLIDGLGGVRRLVLLGDVLELRHGPLREALAVAEPVLRAIGAGLSAESEIVLVPGNHDHQLLAPWLGRRELTARSPPLGTEAAVDWREGEPLHQLAAWLAPARVRVAYPGVWLGEGVYATHGHYADLHTTVPMFERLGAGAMARIAGPRGRAPAAAEDYEAVLGPIYAWIHALAQSGAASLGNSGVGPSSRMWSALGRDGAARRGSSSWRRRSRRAALGAGVAVAVRTLDRAGLGPLRTDLSVAELRRAGLRAFDQVLERLGVLAPHVIFGHTHRAGPLPGDDQGEWRTSRGTRLLNSGCWVYERGFLGSAPARSPYRAGFAVRVPETGEPELVNLLDEAPAES